MDPRPTPLADRFGPLPTRHEVLGLAGLCVGFVVFTYGLAGVRADVDGPATLALLAGGGAVGGLSAAYLVVIYAVLEVVD